MSATTYFENKLLDDLFGVAPYSPPTLYLALLTADPTAAGLLTNEVGAGLGYARASLAGIIGAASSGLSVSTTLISIGPATASWGTITFLGIMDSPTIGAGNMIWPGVPSQARTINTGQPFQLPAGQLFSRAR